MRSRPHTDSPRILPDSLNRPPPVSSKGTGRRPDVRNFAMTMNDVLYVLFHVYPTYRPRRRVVTPDAAKQISCQSGVVVLYLFREAAAVPGGDRPADPQSFEPRRFGRRDRGARVPNGKNGVARKWRRNGLKRLNPRPGNGMGSEASYHKIWYTGAVTATWLGSRRNNKVTKLQKKALKALKMVTCKTEIGSALRRSRSPGAKKGSEDAVGHGCRRGR